MQSVADSKFSACNKYATFRFVADSERGVTIPIGVAVWGSDTSSLKIRFPKKGDRFDGADVNKVLPYLEVVKTQIESWLKNSYVPYQQEALEPLSDAWWDQVRKLLRFKVRVDEPKPIECVRPDLELESLYEAVAKPKQPSKHRRARLDGLFKKAVGNELADKFQTSEVIPGYKKRLVPVFRHAEVDKRHIIVEVVNLAIPEAERDADALASRLQRIKEGPLSQHTSFVLGYIASPSGLNGEGVMKNWVELKSGTRMYDIVREGTEFSSNIAEALITADQKLRLFPDNE